MKLGTPIYKPYRVHVVRYMKGAESRTMTSPFSFRWMKRRIEKLHGKEAAATAVSWGWRIPPVD